MQFEFLADLPHGQRMQRLDAFREEIALRPGDDLRDADDRALAQFERAHEVPGLLELFA